MGGAARNGGIPWASGRTARTKRRDQETAPITAITSAAQIQMEGIPEICKAREARNTNLYIRLRELNSPGDPFSMGGCCRPGIR